MTGKAKPTEVRAMSLNHGQFWVGDDQGNVRRLWWWIYFSLLAGSRIHTSLKWKKLLKKFLTFLQLIEYGENFVAKQKKLIYTEIWSLALAPDGTNLICARDNDCNIYDLGMNFVSTILQLLSL